MKKLISKLFAILNKKKIIKLGKYQLETNHSHMLDVYKKKYPLYDLFLAHICSNFSGLIIDVGANIGDTAISIFSKNDRSFIVGVEPDEDFGKTCIQNIRKNKLEDRFLLVDKFITNEKGNFKIEKNKSGSTGSKVATDEPTTNSSISFSELVLLIPKEQLLSIDMLKIDTDGYDWDIIDSYCESIESHSHVKARFVFFELQTFLNNIGLADKDRADRTLKHKSAIERLYRNGYDSFTLFDNFGTYLMTTSAIEEIISISDYIGRSQLHNNHSTFYHLDILAFNKTDQNFVKQQLDSYQK